MQWKGCGDYDHLGGEKEADGRGVLLGLESWTGYQQVSNMIFMECSGQDLRLQSREMQSTLRKRGISAVPFFMT